MTFVLRRDLAAPLGHLTLFTGTVSLGSSYPSGGWALDLAPDLTNVKFIQFESRSGFVLDYDRANKKVRVFRVPTLTPAGTISKPSFVVRAAGAIGALMGIGLSADSDAATLEGDTGITAERTLTTTSPVGIPTFSGTPIAQAALAEVAAGTDLSSLSDVGFFAVGTR